MSHKTMTLQEFWDVGFLQEANRRFFHPLGLALSIIVDESGAVRFGDIWDSRDDEEGIMFADGMIEPNKAERVTEEFNRHMFARSDLFGGSIIQPVPKEIQKGIEE